MVYTQEANHFTSLIVGSQRSMPRRSTGRRKKSRAVVRRRTRRAQRGGSWWKNVLKFGSRANRWLKKTKAISKAAGIGSALGLPYAGTIKRTAGMVGYGKRRRRVVRRRRRQYGKGIGLSGGALMLAGQRRLGGRGASKKKGFRNPPPISY